MSTAPDSEAMRKGFENMAGHPLTATDSVVWLDTELSRERRVGFWMGVATVLFVEIAVVVWGVW